MGPRASCRQRKGSAQTMLLERRRVPATRYNELTSPFMSPCSPTIQLSRYRAPGVLLKREKRRSPSKREGYRQAELLEGRFDEGGVLGQDLLQVPPALHVPEN